MGSERYLAFEAVVVEKGVDTVVTACLLEAGAELPLGPMTSHPVSRVRSFMHQQPQFPIQALSPKSLMHYHPAHHIRPLSFTVATMQSVKGPALARLSSTTSSFCKSLGALSEAAWREPVPSVS